MGLDSFATRSPTLTPIGRVRTPWSPADCPKNIAEARDRGQQVTLLIDPPWRAGLAGLERASHLILLGWFGDVDRNVLVQKPRHLKSEQGCFSIRTPARPNPIAMTIVRRKSVGHAAGLVTVDALDWFDGTPLLDIKPYYATTDAYPEAQVIPG